MKLIVCLFVSLVFVVGTISCNQNNETETTKFVFVEGGKFKNTHTNYYGKDIVVSSFWIGKYEVTQKEWQEVIKNNPSHFKGDNLPVENVSWYDCIEYCNKRSIKEGLTPYYTIDKTKKDLENINKYDDIKWIVTINPKANGYRLPTGIEWEYAASGGQKSMNYEFAGSNNIEEVANYSLTGDGVGNTMPIGTKKPNELDIYDMSGNVDEWCYEWYDKKNNPLGYSRVIYGGSWFLPKEYCYIKRISKRSPIIKYHYSGLRLIRNVGKK